MAVTLQSRDRSSPRPVGEQMELLFDDAVNELSESLPDRLPDPPDLDSYTVRVSKQARSVSLRVLPLHGLEVTIPRRFPRREVPAVIAENREWISRQFAKVREETDPEFLVWPPRVLRLRAIDSVVSVNCTPTSASSVRASWSDAVLSIDGNIADRQAVMEVIVGVLKQRARVVLLPQLTELAALHGLSFKRCAIRGQKTVWGSYSSSGTLSLNYKLLFLPPELVQYVLLHELAHIRHLNHSRQYWAFLETMQTGAKTLDRALGEAGKLVPPWLETL
ncbi:MAG: M48 family metallopeptidase [Gammaproteobacteria bacterium]|nr:M48 family metallopeptidase [Gammaproteobacteria bacterium]